MLDVIAFTYDPPVDAATVARWQAQLDAYAPRSDQMAWVKLVWEPGDPWAPVQRWMLYEMLPRTFLDPWVVEELSGPDPRTRGYFDKVAGRFVESPDQVFTKRQWDLYRETGCFGRPFWVLQGSGGGHKRWFTDTESRLLALGGFPTEPPPPGSLPYAPFDRRVLEHLATLDRLKRGTEKLNALRLSESRAAAERKLMEELVGWLGEQMGEAAEMLLSAVDTADIPRSEHEQAPDIDEVQERFVSGQPLHGEH